MAKRTLVSEALAVRANASGPVLEAISSLLDEELPPDVERIILYLHGHLFQPRVVYYLRRRLGLNESAFFEFQIRFGASVENFVHEMRVEVAKIMLRTSSLSISATSKQLGYTTPRDFTRVFKNRIEATPSEYRSSPTREAREPSVVKAWR